MRWMLACLLGTLPALAGAQVTADAAIVSDYRFRGVSLSDGQAAAQAGIGVDFSSQAYGGLFATTTRFADTAPTRLAGTVYAGLAHRLADGASVDAGATYSTFAGVVDYNYAEVHAGYTDDRLGARIYFAPNYFGQSVRTMYAEINAARQLPRALELLLHAGALVRVSGHEGDGRLHADASLGIGATVAGVQLQLSRVFSDGADRFYPMAPSTGRNAWVARASLAF